jgi:cytochrome P450
VVATYPFDTPAGSEVEPEGLRLLTQGPVTRASMHGYDVWLVLGYQAVRQVLSDPRFSREAAARPDGPIANPAGFNPEFLVSMDPPRHTRIRGLMAKAFSPRTVEGLEPWMRQLVDGLLDELAEHGKPADLVRLLAEPLPIMVICQLLGVPIEDRAQIRQWAGKLMSDTAFPPEEIAEAMGQVNAYLDELVAARRRNPDDALISALIAVNDEGGHLTAAELTSNIQLLLIAGHETTVNQISNSVVTLFKHPDQASLLAKQPQLRPRAVQELLRYSRLLSAVLPRVATADVPLGDVVIRAGEAVVPLIAVANRDPDAFPDPNRFDITRTGPAPHMAFGHGPHYCIGAPLAQLELQIALGALWDRFPSLAPAVDLDDLSWKPGLAVRAVRALPVTW